MPDLFYVNGEIVAPQEARISAGDRGFRLGDALFETMRAYHGTIFRLEEHLQRFRRSARFLGFPDRPSNREVAEAIRSTLEASEYTDAYVRMTVTGGTGGTLTGRPDGGATMVIEIKRFTPYPARLFRDGAHLVVSRYRQDADSPLAGHKTTDYLVPILARREAQARDADDAVLLNHRGDVAEATVSNVFIVRGGTVMTPALEAGALPGVTRAAVIEICRDAGFPCQEAALTPDDLSKADECFLTNTLMEILPVATIERRIVSKDVPGPRTRDIARLYRDLTDRLR